MRSIFDYEETNMVSPKQIQVLRREAEQAGDSAQITLCSRALQGDITAMAKCARVIVYAARERARG